MPVCLNILQHSLGRMSSHLLTERGFDAPFFRSGHPETHLVGEKGLKYPWFQESSRHYKEVYKEFLVIRIKLKVVNL